MLDESVSVNIQDLVSLKNIERGDLLIVYADSDEEIKRAQKLGNVLGDRFGTLMIIQRREDGPIEKMSREEFIRIGRVMGILPRE